MYHPHLVLPLPVLFALAFFAPYFMQVTACLFSLLAIFMPNFVAIYPRKQNIFDFSGERKCACLYPYT